MTRRHARPMRLSLTSALLLLASWTAGAAALMDDAGHDATDAHDHAGTASLPLGRSPVVRRTDPEVCYRACQLALRPPSYSDVEPGASFLDKECQSRLMQTSLFLCLRSNCHGDDAANQTVDYHDLAGLHGLNESCTKYMQAPLPPIDSVLAAYPDDVVARLRRLQRAEAAPDTRLDEVVVLSEQLYENAYDTLSYYGYVHGHHLSYSALMLLFWLVVILYGIGSRLFSAATRRLRRRHTLLTPTIGRAAYQPLDGSADVQEAQEEQLLSGSGEDGTGRGFYAKGKSAPGLQDVRHIASRPRVWLRRYITMPATFGYRCAQDFGWYTVPPRIQTLTLAAFVALNIYASVTGYRVFTGNMWWPTISQQFYRYVSDRTGFLSFVNFPLIWLFGMRNNVLLWLTGWDFGTYNNFHRWVARVATVEAIVHSIGYTILVWKDGGFPAFLEWWALFFWWTGGVATIAMSLLLGFSLFWMRRHTYELFLVIHIAFSILIVLGMIGHVSIFHGRFDVFWWACIAIWAFDRTLRALRILAFNPLFWNTRAKVTYDAQANILRLVVPYTASFYQPKPGTYYYIHVLNDKRFWESHPFTVSTVSTLNKNLANGGVGAKARRAQVVELSEQLSDVQSERGSPAYDAPPQQFGANESSGLLYGTNQSHQYQHLRQENHRDQQRPSSSHTAHTSLSTASTPVSPASAASALTFLIRPYDGFTSRLRDRAAAAAATSSSSSDYAGWSAPASIRVLVDGPYGHSHRFDDGSYESVLFVVGGSGIVVPLSHLTGLGRDRMLSDFSSAKEIDGPQRRRLRNIHIVWAVREAEFAASVLREDLQDVLADDDGDLTGVRVSMDVYVTRASPFVVGDAGEYDEADRVDHVNGGVDGGVDGDVGRHDDSKPSLDGHQKGLPPFDEPLPRAVRVLYDRPDVRGEIECAAKRDARDGRLAVVACGPGRMADEARRAVVEVLGSRGITGDIEYLEESFQW